jgi:hypothetical protein
MKDDKDSDGGSDSSTTLIVHREITSLTFREIRSPGRQPSGSVSAGNNPSQLSCTDFVQEPMRGYEYGHASETKLTRPLKAQQAIKGLAVGKAPAGNGISNNVLRYQ